MTPETVLRAMLAVYDADLLLREVAFQKKGPTGGDKADVFNSGSRYREVRNLLVWHLAGRLPWIDSRNFTWRTVAEDYQARLNGSRPLDTPPLEV